MQKSDPATRAAPNTDAVRKSKQKTSDTAIKTLLWPKTGLKQNCMIKHTVFPVFYRQKIISLLIQ